MSNDNFLINAENKTQEFLSIINQNFSKTTDSIQLPQLYKFATFLAEKYSCEYIIEIGCGHALDLINLYPRFNVIGIDKKENIQFCQNQYSFGNWVAINLENPDIEQLLRSEILEKSIIICANVIEHLFDPDPLVKTIAKLSEIAPAVLLTSVERDIVRKENNSQYLKNANTVREWNQGELFNYLESRGVKVAFSGLTICKKISQDRNTSLCVICSRLNTEEIHPPASFRVVAILGVYNEEDVIVPIINNFYKQGVGVYLIDNWSTDETFVRAQSLLGKGLIGIEKFPKDEPSLTYDWGNLLNRKKTLANELDADWFMHSDADEIRESPWEGVNLRDAIYRVDCEGYNAIDFTVINFPPIDNNYQQSTSLTEYFKYFEFGNRPGHFLRINTWKKTATPVDLSSSGGHEVKFDNRRIYPLKFLLRHYPVRSQSHGEKKVFQDRKLRWNPDEKKMGWHVQYDEFSPGWNFLKKPDELILFDQSFYTNYLIERLSGIGIRMSNTENDQINDSPKKVGDFKDPNKYARPFSIEEGHDQITFHGYQDFVLSTNSLEILDLDQNLINKASVLKNILTPRLVKNRTVLDLGANSGYFCHLALQNGAQKAVAVEMDKAYVGGLYAAKKKFSLDTLDVIEDNFEDIQTKADVVIALAFIHWVFSCTAKFGSLDSVVEKLAGMTDYALIVEWIDTDDPAIKFFNHIDWNPEYIQEPYSFSAFEAALNKYFARIALVGEVTPTRRIFIAYKTKADIYADSPFPILDTGKLISARLLDTHNGIDYWSQVYEDKEYVYKQATGDLASREFDFLSQLRSSYFPKILTVQKHDQYSVIKMEKIHGTSLDDFENVISTDRNIFYKFIHACLDILEQLNEKGITHRDIRPDNILVRDNLPVLLDFGWAISEEHPYFTPPGLGAEFVSSDRHYCDTFSMGMVLTQLNNDRYPEVTDWLRLMTTTDRQDRITDIRVLRKLFSAYVEKNLGKDGLQFETPETFSYLLIKQYNQLAKISTLVEKYKQQIQTLTNEKEDREQRVFTLEKLASEREQRIWALESIVAEKEHQIQAMETQTLGRQQQNQELLAQLNDLKQQVIALDAQLNQTQTELLNARSEAITYSLSTSWRLMRPFRKIRKFLMRK